MQQDACLENRRPGMSPSSRKRAVSCTCRNISGVLNNRTCAMLASSPSYGSCPWITRGSGESWSYCRA